MAGGNLTDIPYTITYANVGSRESVGIELLVAVLIDLEILEGGIHNDYLNAYIKEKMFFYSMDLIKVNWWLL